MRSLGGVLIVSSPLECCPLERDFGPLLREKDSVKGMVPLKQCICQIVVLNLSAPLPQGNQQRSVIHVVSWS